MATTWLVEEVEEGVGRHQRNGHTLELHGLWWKCLQCLHSFDAATDAELFWCGDPCKHP